MEFELYQAGKFSWKLDNFPTKMKTYQLQPFHLFDFLNYILAQRSLG